jgi:hypothetical protein
MSVIFLLSCKLPTSDIQYALALHDMSNIENLVNNHVKKYIKNDPKTSTDGPI